MIGFNGFDKGVIGRRMPADSTLKRMKKTELINLLHIAEHNHSALVESYTRATDNSKCNDCPLPRRWHDAKKEKPTNEDGVLVCFSGVDGKIRYTNCYGVGSYWAADDEWEIDSVSAAAKFTVHGWKEIEEMHTD